MHGQHVSSAGGTFAFIRLMQCVNFEFIGHFIFSRADRNEEEVGTDEKEGEKHVPLKSKVRGREEKWEDTRVCVYDVSHEALAGRPADPLTADSCLASASIVSVLLSNKSLNMSNQCVYFMIK